MTFFSKNKAMLSTAVKAPETETGTDAPEVYTAEAFKEYEMGQYRERFPNETRGLSDRAIFDAAMATDDDLDDDAWRELFAKVDRPAVDGDTMAARARGLGAKVGEASETAIATVMKAKEDWQGGPFRVLFGLQEDFTEEELNGFPVPDDDAGNNPDIFNVTKEDAKTGKLKSVKSNFYVNFADGTPSGQHILAQIEFTQRAGNTAMVQDDIPEDIREMTPHERENHLNFLNGRRNTIRQSYKNAMALYFKFIEVNNYPGVKAEPIWAKGKSPDDEPAGGIEVENTTKPIAVWLIPDEGKPIAKWEALSIGAFKKLNAKKGLEKGGTFASLISSGATKKAPGSGATTDKNDGFVIKTADKFFDVFAEGHRFIDEMLNDKRLVEYGKLLQKMNAKDNDELVTDVVELRNFFVKLCDDTNADAKYVKIQSSGSPLADKVKAATK